MISKQKLEIQLKATGINVTKAQLKALHKQVNMTKTSMQGLGISLASASLAMYATGRALASIINTGRQFEQSMANVKAISGATGDQFKALEENAKGLGRTTIFTASQVAELQTEFAKLGFTATEITEVTQGTLALASAVGTDLATAASTAGSTLRGFNLDVDQTNRVTDVMALSFSRSALDMAKFTDSMKYVAPIANATGVSIEGATSILGQLANAGLAGSMAGTGLRKVLLEAGNAGSKLAKRMGGPISSFEDFQKKLKMLRSEGLDPVSEGAELVGTRAVTAFSIMLQAADDTDKLNEALISAGGSAQRMADVQIDTLSGSMKLATSAMDGLKIEMFEMHDEGLKNLVDGFTKFISAIKPSDIQAYENALKVTTAVIVTYGVHIATATILTKGFTAAIAGTGLLPMAIGATILVAELIRLTDQMDESSESAVDQALKIKMVEDAYKNFKMEINSLTGAGLSEELSFQNEVLGSLQAELENSQTALDGMGHSYEDYIRLKNEDGIGNSNLIDGYDSYLSLFSSLPSNVGKAAMSLEDYVAAQDKNSGTMTDGITSMEAYHEHSHKIKNDYINESEEIKRKIKVTEKDIQTIEDRQKKIEDDKSTAIIAENAEKVIRIKQAEMDKSLTAINNFNKSRQDKDKESYLIEFETLSAHLNNVNLLESEKAHLRAEIYLQFKEKKKIADDKEIEAANKLQEQKDLEEAREKVRGKRAIARTLGQAAEVNKAFGGNAKVTKAFLGAEALMQTYLGAQKAYTSMAQFGPIASAAAAAVAVAAGLANVRAIEQTPEAQYEQGGLINGARHSGGGVNINAEGGEFIMSRNAVNSVGLEAMNSINDGNSMPSMNVNFTGNVMSQDFIEQEAIPMIEDAIRRGATLGA